MSRLLLAAALLLICLLFAAPAAATPDDATVFAGGSFPSASLLADALNAAGEGTVTVSGSTITLAKDINITGTVELTGPVTLLGNGHTIWRGGADFFLINVTSGTLTLGDGSSQLTIHGQNEKYFEDNQFGSFYIGGSSAKLVMTNGVTLKNTTLTGNTAPYTGRGGAVTVHNGAVFEMQGGLITGNTAGRAAVNVYGGGSRFTMSGGEISGNTASNAGGGVYVGAPGGEAASFTMTGGKISGNTASGDGGGVYVFTGCTMTLSGGEISGNTAKYGGGISNYGALMLSGGEISGNTASTRGGGVLLVPSGTLTMSGTVKITGNTAPNAGGIYNNGIITLSGGTISDNIATSNDRGSVGGGGIYNTGGIVTMSDGIISGNSGRNGGAVLSTGTSKFIMTGGEISGNTARNPVSGIIAFPNSQGNTEISLTGGRISDNNGRVVFCDSGNTITVGGSVLFRNNTGTDLVFTGGGKLILNGGTFEKGDMGTNALDLAGNSYIELSGPVTFSKDLPFDVSTASTTINITAPFLGSIQSFRLNTDDLDNKTLITILPGVNQKASEVVSRLGLADTTKWTLAADDAANTIKTVLNKPKVAAGSAAVTWINATIANVSIRLDPDANDATDITVKLGGVSSQTLNGSYAKGSTIKDIQITGLTAGTQYTLSAELKNTGISQSTFTYSDLAATTAPTPAKVVITGDGGNLLGDSVALGQGKSMTFGVLVYDAGNNLLKDEPVSWVLAGTNATKSAATPFSVVLTGGNVDGTDTLTATTVHDSASGSIGVEVTTSEPTSLAVTADATTIEEGGSFSLTATATDNGGKQFAGYDVSWSPSSGSISPSKSGSTVRFTPAAGTCTVSAQISSPSLASNTLTLTIVGKPVITTSPAGADYVKGQTAAALTVTASAPAGGSGDLGYSWEKSTDPSFASGVTVVGTSESLTPDISAVGTVYYRVNVSYTQDGFSTYAASSAAKVTVVNPVADSISLTKANDGTRVVTITAAVTNATIGAMQNAGVGWEVISGTENISLSGSGNSVAATGKRDGTATVKAVALGNFSTFSTIDITVTAPPLTPTPTVPTPYPTSSGGSGGGSSSSGSVSSTGQASFGTSTGVTGVSFAKGTTGLVTLETKPAGVAAPANAHAVVDISAPAFEGAAEISFSVPVSVLRDQGLGVNDVVMQHYVNGQWVKIPTFFVGEERGAAKYVAQTTGFSPFAIVYESGGAQTVERSTPQPTKDAGASAMTKPTAKQTESKTSATTSATAAPTTSVATGGATAVPTMTQAPVPVAGMLLGLLAAAGVLIRRRE